MAWVRNNTDEGKNFIHWWIMVIGCSIWVKDQRLLTAGMENTFWVPFKFG